MKNKRLVVLLIALLACAPAFALRGAAQVVSPAVQDDSIEAFWQKFRAAVIKGDKPAVVALSQFPISMPYGYSLVRNKAQLTRRYRQVFNHEGSAVKCFIDAVPKTDPERPKEFTVGCKNPAGDEVVIYTFTKTKNGWRFIGLDNLNE